MARRNPEEQHRRMLETPVYRLVPTLAVPSTITMLITSIYNMADTFFVSRLGTSATGAVGVVYSLMAVIQAVGFMLGMGSHSLVSRHLGAGERKKASITASVGFFSALAIGLVLTIGGSMFRAELVDLLGASSTMSEDAQQYAKYILYAAPLMCATFQMNNVLRAEGNAALGTFAMTTGGILNMILDPVFIFLLDFGVAGAAIATAFSQATSFSILLFMYLSGRSSIRLDIRHVFGNLQELPMIISTGFPSLCRQGLASLASVCLNRAVRPYGDAALAAISIVSRITQFQGRLANGLGQGGQPVVGYSYGAKRYSRVYETIRFTILATTGLMLTLSVLVFFWAPELIALFREGDAQVIAIGTLGLQLNCLVQPLSGLYTTVSMSLQVMGKSKRSALLSSCRQGWFFLPLISILPRCLGLTGAQVAQPVADVLMFLLGFWFFIQLRRELLDLAEKQKTITA